MSVLSWHSLGGAALSLKSKPPKPKNLQTPITEGNRDHVGAFVRFCDQSMDLPAKSAFQNTPQFCGIEKPNRKERQLPAI